MTGIISTTQTSNGFFEISSPRDMLEKAKRELARMQTEVNIDTIFNFFVTTYHVMDYVKVQGVAPRTAINAMYQDHDFELCRFICNKGKHLILQNGDKVTETVHNPGAVFGGAIFGSSMFGQAPSNTFFIDGQVVDFVNLGNKLIAKWDVFFTNYGI